MFFFALLAGVSAMSSDTACLTPDQDKDLKTSIGAIDGTLQVTATSLNIAAMWKTGVEQENLQNASKIITAIDKDLVEKMTAITEKTCGTCSQITKSIGDITKDLEKTMADIEPDWKTNPIYNSVTMVLNMILGIVPNFCPSEMEALRAMPATDPAGVPCLNKTQDRTLHTSIMAIDATLKITVTSLNIAGMWQKDPVVQDNLKNASRIISAIDTQLVTKMSSIVESTCGTCKQIVASVKNILHDLENTMVQIEPDWKTNPIYNSIVMVLNMIVGIIPEFCPTPTDAPTMASTPKPQLIIKRLQHL